MGKSWLFDIKMIANMTFFTKCYKNQFVKFAMFHQLFITLQTSFNANLHRGCCFARREQVHKLLANYFNSYHKMWFFRNETMFSEA